MTQRPVRNVRKRKRFEESDVNLNHDVKRRKTTNVFNLRYFEGFCNYCTNPYKLISCQQCYRSWHFNCFKKYIIKDNTNNTNNNNNNNNLIPNGNNKIKSDNDSNIQNLHNELSQQCNMNVNIPNPATLSTINNRKKNTNFDSEITKLMQNNQKKQTKMEKSRNPDPIRMESLPNINYLNIQNNNKNIKLINVWFKSNQNIINNKLELHYNEYLKQIIGIIESCPDCLNNTHKCFICKKNDKNIVKCYVRGCSKYYHSSCLLSDSSYKYHTEIFTVANKLKCPQHHCWKCYELNNGISRKTSKYSSYLKSCAHCPRSYHRNCVPDTAELISVQRTDTIDDLNKYPPFRYDLITCCWNDNKNKKRLNPPHPPPKNLQFGRNDAEAGIFIWDLSGYKYGDENWNIAEFYTLKDDPFSISLALLTNYEKKQKIKNKKLNPYPKGFKKIKKSRYGSNYKRDIKPILMDVDRCNCIKGCSLDWSCQNYSMDIECDDTICGSFDKSLCLNRQFQKVNSRENVEIKYTENTGFGAFAKKDLIRNQLIIEYVGEIITKEESNRRLARLNELKALNFYFFQVDGKTIIDGTRYGNEARFMNHSCSPNCHTIRWYVNGEQKLGIFASVDIKKNEQLTYDYQYKVENCDDVSKLAKCKCGSDNCRIYLGFDKKKAEQYKIINKLNIKKSKKKHKHKHKKKKKKKRKKKEKKLNIKNIMINRKLI